MLKAGLRARLEGEEENNGRTPDRPEHRPRFLGDRILKAVGVGSFGIRRASRLLGMSRGEQKPLGTCRHADRDVIWDYWFPHIGIAVDAEMPTGGQAEAEAKLEWATERGILYFSPITNTQTPGRIDLGLLASAVAQRRGGGGE